MSTSQPGPRPDHATNDQPQIKTLQQLQDTLNEAFKYGFNPHPTQYKRVAVQFFHFKDGDLDVDGVEKELGHVFQHNYGFTVRYYEIGTDQTISTFLEVQQVCIDLHREFGGDRCLLILVFSGHGEVEYFAKKRTLWVGGALDPNGAIQQPKLNWVNATSGLNTTASDVLHIMDCCCAAEAVSVLGAEVIAATSGTEAASAEPEKSLTKAVAKQLRLLNGAPVTAAQFYSELIRNREFFDLEYTPFYCPRRTKSSVNIVKHGADPSMVSKGKKVAKDDVARVVIKAHLKEALEPKHIDQLKRWLVTNVPESVTGLDVRCEGYFKSGFGVLLLSMPVELWVSLDDNPAFGFVAWVKSNNLLLRRAGIQQGPLETLPTRGSENVRPGSGPKP